MVLSVQGLYAHRALPSDVLCIRLMLAQGKQDGCDGTGRSVGKQPRALQPKPEESTFQTHALALLSVAAEGARVAPGLAALCRASTRCPFGSHSSSQQLPFN